LKAAILSLTSKDLFGGLGCNAPSSLIRFSLDSERPSDVNGAILILNGVTAALATVQYICADRDHATAVREGDGAGGRVSPGALLDLKTRRRHSFQWHYHPNRAHADAQQLRSAIGD
jgi:hypothetical protein